MYDVIVVGAGPAGSVAAYCAAQAGMRTLVFDVAQFPRDKVCGGGVTFRARNALCANGIDIESVVEDEVHEAVISRRGCDEFTVQSNEPIAYMVRRSRFDEFLKDHAVRAGAEVREGVKVSSIRCGPSDAAVRTSSGDAYCGKWVIGADGAKGVTAKLRATAQKRCQKKYKRPRVKIGALETEMEIPESLRDRIRGKVLLSLFEVRNGYGWVFPKSNGVASIGVGGTFSNGQSARDQLTEYCDRIGIAEPLAHSHPIPYFRRGRKHHWQRVLYVGDAAGLIEPFLFEGIYYAVASAVRAIRALVEMIDSESARFVCKRYEALMGDLRKDLCRRARIAWWFYRYPEVCYDLLKSRPAVRDMCLAMVVGKIDAAVFVRRYSPVVVLEIIRDWLSRRRAA